MSEQKPKIIYASITERVSVKCTGTASVFKRPAPDDKIHNLVGRVAAEWAYIEHLLDQIIWKLSGIENATGACLTAQIIGSGPRILTIMALCKHKNISDDIIGKVKKFGDGCFDVQQRRNRILHDSWWRSQGGEDAFQFKAKPKGELSFGLTQVSEEFLHETLDKISRKTEYALELLNIISSLPRT